MSEIQIVPFSQDLKPYFESINKAWVSKFFSLEPFDLDQLEHPEDTILAKGGAILFAKIGDETVGTVGLVPLDSETCEMIKMGVDPAAQGKGVGKALGEAVIAHAKTLGFSKMALYSNSVLDSALRLYQRIGFQEVELECGAYGRCNVKMERAL